MLRSLENGGPRTEPRGLARVLLPRVHVLLAQSRPQGLFRPLRPRAIVIILDREADKQWPSPSILRMKPAASRRQSEKRRAGACGRGLLERALKLALGVRDFALLLLELTLEVKRDGVLTHAEASFSECETSANST